MRGRVDLHARGARATCAPIVRVLVVVLGVCVAPLGAWAEAPVLTTTAAATEPGAAPDAILSRFSRPYPAPGSVPSPPSAARSKSPSAPKTPGGNITGPGHGTKDPNNSIDDADDRVPADQAAAIASTLPGVPIDPRVFARFGACTATHLGRGIFLTAGHCIDQQEGLIGFRSSPCPQDLLLYRDATPRRCNVVAFGYDAKNDFALLEVVDSAALVGHPSLPVDYAIDWTRVKKRWIRLFGYSGGQLRANLWCEANYDAKSGRLIHSCDTEGGDSGSALIDMMTGHVVGVHGGGLTTGKNYGFPIGRIPWAETLCVSVATSPRIPVFAGGAVGAIRASSRAASSTSPRHHAARQHAGARARPGLTPPGRAELDDLEQGRDVDLARRARPRSEQTWTVGGRGRVRSQTQAQVLERICRWSHLGLSVSSSTAPYC